MPLRGVAASWLPRSSYRSPPASLLCRALSRALFLPPSLTHTHAHARAPSPSLCQWDELKREIRRSPEFRFDWIFKSRTPQELSRRVDLLIRLVLNEGKEGGAAGGRGAGTKRPADGAAAAAPPPAKLAKDGDVEAEGAK